jgi:hypothetical protein
MVEVTGVGLAPAAGMRVEGPGVVGVFHTTLGSLAHGVLIERDKGGKFQRSQRSPGA